MKKVFFILLTFVLAFAICACGNEKAKAEDPTVVTATGTYIGQEKNGVSEFLGISYAAPIKRWQPPEAPKTTSDEVIYAQEWGPSCIQIDDKVEVASQWKQDEDCLDLNIWTKDINSKNKPVMVFFHGGGNWRGGTYDPSYYGGNFVKNLNDKEDCIMVTVNFRLGIFGSLNLSSLNGYTEEYKDSINLNVLDQIRALEWINENIENFGGNPENVTIFGQSAGGGAVSALLTIDKAKGLFHKVIAESGNIFNREISIEQSLKNAEKVFDILEVSSLEELLAITDDEIRENYQEELDMESARYEVAVLRNEINALGHVNLDAIEEYEEVSKRYEDMNGQRLDLIQAQDKIIQAIDEMDDIMVEKFSTTFDKINYQFNLVFRELFGGGRAEIKYTDPNNILETGIDIDVQPPGKSVSNITLFSGGEKALIAISCLFAILKVRPVPMCILDEVEAALDMANVERFAKFLREFSSQTQFIVVTHREGTMEECDLLYGATMQQKGVTKLVSVKLEEAVDFSNDQHQGGV